MGICRAADCIKVFQIQKLLNRGLMVTILGFRVYTALNFAELPQKMRFFTEKALFFAGSPGDIRKSLAFWLLLLQKQLPEGRNAIKKT